MRALLKQLCYISKHDVCACVCVRVCVCVRACVCVRLRLKRCLLPDLSLSLFARLVTNTYSYATNAFKKLLKRIYITHSLTLRDIFYATVAYFYTPDSRLLDVYS